MKPKNRLVFSSLITAALASQLHAANVTWTGNSTANFNLAGNWNPGVPPNNSMLVFGGNGTSGTTLNNDITSLSLASGGGITFDAGAPAYIISGNTFTLGSLGTSGSIVVNSVGVTQTINNNVNVAGTANLSGAGNLTLGGTWARTPGGATVNMNGTGVLNLNASPNQSNLVFNVNSGTVILGTGVSIGSALVVNGGTIKQTAANQINSSGFSSGVMYSPTVNGGTIDLGGFSARTVIKGTGGQVVNNGSSSATLSMGDAGGAFASYAGNIADGNQTLSLVIATGSSATYTQMLSGNNAYSGGTRISAFASNAGTTTLSISSMANIGTSGSRDLTFWGGTGATNPGSERYLQITGTTIANSNEFNSITFTSTAASGFDIADSTHTYTLSNAVDSGTGAFYKRGAGTLVMTANNTYTGGTVLNGGTLKVDYVNGGKLSSTTAPTFAGGTLYLSGNASTATQTLGNVAVNAGGGNIVVDGIAGTGGIALALGTVGPTAAGSTLDISRLNSAGNVTTSSTGTNGLLGSGRVTYREGSNIDFAGKSGSNIAAASYTGGTLPVSGGNSTLNYSHTGNATVDLSESVNALKVTSSATGQALTINSTETLTLTSGGLLFTGADAYSITGGTLKSNTATNSDLIVHQYGAGNLTISSVIANGIGASTLTKAGTGTLILGTTNTYTGATYVNGGTLSISANDRLGGNATSQATLFLNGGGILQSTGTFSLQGNATTNRAVGVGGGGGGFDVTDSNTLTVTGSISASGELKKLGTGTLQLNAANNMNGGVRIEDGTLKLNAANAINNGSGHANNALVFGSGTTAKLQLNGTNASVLSLVASNTNAIVENSHATTNSTLTVANGADNTFAGVLQNGGTGTLGLTKSGGGTLTLSNTNTYTGATTISNGVLSVGSIGDGGVAGNLGQAAATATNLVFNGGTLKYTGANATSNRDFTINAGTTATIDTTNNISFAGAAGTATTGALTKIGAGTLTLDGINTYTGATAVNEGKLTISSTGRINGTSGITIAGGEFNYNSSTALSQGVSFSGTGGTLSGSGTITPAVTITSDNTYTPGEKGAAGTQTLTGGVTFDSGSIFNWDIDISGSTETGRDKVINTGGLAGSSAIFNVVLGTGDAYTDAFWNTNQTWSDVFSVGTLASVFSSITGTGLIWDSATSRGNVADQGYFTMATNTLSWTAVPEPTSALAGLLITAGLLRRRRMA